MKTRGGYGDGIQRSETVGFEIMEIGAAFLPGVWRFENGIEDVRRYAILRRRHPNELNPRMHRKRCIREYRISDTSRHQFPQGRCHQRTYRFLVIDAMGPRGCTACSAPTGVSNTLTTVSGSYRFQVASLCNTTPPFSVS